jgi:hypothetical protein
MFTRKSGILALALSVVVLGACEDDESGPQLPPPAATIQIQPNPVPALAANAPFTLVAVTQNAPAGSTIAWTSSNPNITVTQAGVVTCTTAGAGQTGTITATISGTTPPATAAVAVSCQGSGPVTGTPTISISRITNAAGLDVNPGAVAGVINVVMNVDIPTGVQATAARVMLGTQEACRTTFSSGSEFDLTAAVPVTVVCSFNTAELTSTGAPRWPNGTYQVVAELVNGTTVLASSTSRTLVFANVDALAVNASASGASNTDLGGLVWRTGDLTVTVIKSIFTPSQDVVSGVVTVRDNVGNIIAQAPLPAANASGQYVVTFTKAVNTTNGNLDVSEAESAITVEVTTINAAGNNGLSFGPAAPSNGILRLDNDSPDTEAPDPAATFVSPGWFSTATPIATEANRQAFVANFATLDDEGVNRNTVTLQYNTNPAATNTSSGWTTFTDISALPETITTSELAFRAVVCDVLSNCVNVGPALGGVDRSVPSVRIDDPSSANQNEINPAQELFVIGTDAISGVNRIRVTVSGRSVFEVDANVDTDLRCYNGGTGALVSTNPTSGACSSVDVTTASGPGATENSATIIIPADENWYTIVIQTVDIAGNVSTTVLTQNNLVDAEVPTATISSTTITGTNSSITGTVQDNIQVMAYDSRFLFMGLSTPDHVPFSQPTTVDATLDNTLTGQAAATGSSSLVVRQLQEGLAGPVIQPTAYGFGVFDMANLFGFNGSAIAFGAGDGLQNTAALTFTDTPDPICRTATSTCQSTSNWSLVVQTTVPGSPTTPFANPVARVYWYFTHPGSDNTLATGDDYLVFLGQTDAAAATVLTNATTGERTFTFGIPVGAQFFPALVANYPIHAIAVDAQGDGVMSSGTLQVNN